MATVWAKSNGNWTDTTLWAFWNETTQQIEDYGQVPQANDYVYCNGYTITVTSNISIGNGTITNVENPYTNLSNGDIYHNSNYDWTVIANLITGNATLIRTSSTQNTRTFTFIGNWEVRNGYILHFLSTYTANWYRNIIIAGNVTLNNNSAIFCAYESVTDFPRIRSMTITGNVVSENNFAFFANRQCYTTIITGNLSCIISSNNVHNILNVNGVLFAKHITYIGTTLNINGQIEYQSNNNSTGISFTTMNILNPDTFTWKDISEPRLNPFIIVTDAEMSNRQQYPAEDEVKQGTEYVWGEKVGTYQQPPESVVLKGYRYDNDEKVGTLENENIVGCVTPEDVRKDVPLVGMGVVGSLVVPSVDDVREGVHFDNDSVGTLIVQGGGDRLRIADFGYYTNAQSDTYIVDLTEQDKPKFAVAEERVLIEMFPDLDLDNIPDKYFDDLFVKYLKYRLIVEYYRTAGINSTFTPSEPTTEIVNYQNVRNEVWLNSANIYLKAWAKKYPESITKPHRILL